MRIRHKLALTILLSSLSYAVFSQNSLSIKIGPLKSSKGQMLLLLLDENENTLKEVVAKVKHNTCIITFKNLKPGKYAFKYIHDENSNKKLDTYWIGIPKEGFGFSNGAKAIFGPPKFEETIFVFNKSTTIECVPQHLKF